MSRYPEGDHEEAARQARKRELNRQAQRAFRERKDRRIQELEQRIQVLEEQIEKEKAETKNQRIMFESIIKRLTVDEERSKLLRGVELLSTHELSFLNSGSTSMEMMTGFGDGLLGMDYSTVDSILMQNMPQSYEETLNALIDNLDVTGGIDQDSLGRDILVLVRLGIPWWKIRDRIERKMLSLGIDVQQIISLTNVVRQTLDTQ